MDMSLGRFLQDARFKKNLSVEEVALKSQLSIGTIRACEQGRRFPSAASLRLVLSALDVDQSTWIDTVTWKHPINGTIYDLAPIGGAWPKIEKSIVR